MKRKPDFLLLLLMAFGIGVAATLMLPLSSPDSSAEPASPLQAGIVSDP